MMIEEWRDVVGYEGIYQVSNLGNVRSVLADEHYRAKMLKPHEQTNGYLFVNLWKDKTPKHKTLHRLVAEAFIPNPDKLPCVNHKDEDKHNNCADNLEFCDHKYNINHGSCIARAINSKNARKRHSAEKPVLQCDLHGCVVNEWRSLMDLSRHGIRMARIQECFSNPKRTYKGYKWCPKAMYGEYLKKWSLISNEQ